MRKGICKKGHKIEGDNAYLRNDGTHACKMCTQERSRKRRENKTLYEHDKERMKVRYYSKHEEIKQENRERWAENKTQYNQRQRLVYPSKLRRLKIETLTHYGNGKLACVCCGETTLEFLTLDHINGREKDDRGRNPKKRSGQVLWSYMRKRGFPPGCQTLCWNCNSGRQVNKGICPHKQVQTVPVEVTKCTINRI